MIKTCKTLGIQLRAHTKTHKTIEAAVLQTDGTKRCIAVSTLAEAELYADNGFDDILLAYPITEDKIKRCLALVGKLQQFHVMISGDCGLKCLENHINELPEGKVWSVMVEIDAGYGRTGYFWSDLNAIHHVAKRIKESPKMTLEKLYYHCGSLYNVKTDHERKELQSTHVDRMLEVQNKLNLNGINCTSGIGSTPTCSLAITRNSELTEFHPGNYIFYDYEQYLLGTCTEDDIACCVMTRVIAHKPEKQTILVDCGFTAIGHDGMRQRLPSDFCLIQGHSNLRLVGMTQEIGMIVAKEGELDCSLYPVGTIFYLLPYHSCAAAAMHTVYHIHSGDDITAIWKPVRGW